MTDPLWLSIMRAFIGLQELPGTGSNPVILQWARDLKVPHWYDDDDKPWCALAINRMLMAARLPVARGDKSIAAEGYDLLRAKTFETYGRKLDIPAYGCILVFSRPEGAHVGFYLGERKDAYCVLGGNQTNRISIAWVKKDRLVAMRWPEGTTEEPVLGRVWLNGDATVSTNEG